MRLDKWTLSDVIRWRMCTGCGICVVACTMGKVSLRDVTLVEPEEFFSGGDSGGA